MIEGIEQICSEGQRLILNFPEMDREIALDGGVEVDLPWSELRIADEIPRNVRRHNEMKRAHWCRSARRCTVEPAIEWVERSRNEAGNAKVAAIDPKRIERRGWIAEIGPRINVPVYDVIEEPDFHAVRSPGFD